MYKDNLGFMCRDESDDLRDRLKVAEQQVAELREALRIACADAWPDQSQWSELYIGRAAENLQREALAQTAPKQVPNGPCSVCGDGSIEFCRRHGPTAPKEEQ
jgi:hypothetical protein